MRSRQLSRLIDELIEEQAEEYWERIGIKREHVAYHEAGHAVIALMLGYKVGKVTIKPRYGSVGSVDDIQPGETSSDKVVDIEATGIKIDLAGPLAEQLINPEPFNELIKNGSSTDWRSARRTARQTNTRGEAEVLIFMLAMETKTLVEQHRDVRHQPPPGFPLSGQFLRNLANVLLCA